LFECTKARHARRARRLLFPLVYLAQPGPGRRARWRSQRGLNLPLQL